MIKKIKVSRLKPGHYIYDMNCDWMSHPFLFNKMKIKDHAVIKKIIEYGIQEVYIDTEKGLDVDDEPSQHDQACRFIEETITQASVSVAEKSTEYSIRQEFIRARAIIKDAKETMYTLMEDVRLGRQVEVAQVENVVDKMIESISHNKDAMTSLLRIKKKDEYTYVHSLAVGALLVSFAEHLNFDYQSVKAIGVGGLLHDIGKVRVPRHILNKRYHLTDEEFEIMKGHVMSGCEVLEKSTSIEAESLAVVAEHHERFNGSGYPRGLTGDEISMAGQMSAIVDVYDALSSDRCYKRKILPTETLKKLFEWSGTHFKKNLVEQFICCVGIYPVGSVVRLESGLISVVVDHGDKGLLYPVVRCFYDTVNNMRITPHDIDLSKQENENRDNVIAYESPDRWGIRPEDYLSS